MYIYRSVHLASLLSPYMMIAKVVGRAKWVGRAEWVRGGGPIIAMARYKHLMVYFPILKVLLQSPLLNNVY